MASHTNALLLDNKEPQLIFEFHDDDNDDIPFNHNELAEITSVKKG